MAIPNIWGQGQLFAFSALDGNSLFSDDLVGTLSVKTDTDLVAA